MVASALRAGMTIETGGSSPRPPATSGIEPRPARTREASRKGGRPGGPVRWAAAPSWTRSIPDEAPAGAALSADPALDPVLDCIGRPHPPFQTRTLSNVRIPCNGPRPVPGERRETSAAGRTAMNRILEPRSTSSRSTACEQRTGLRTAVGSGFEVFTRRMPATGRTPAPAAGRRAERRSVAGSARRRPDGRRGPSAPCRAGRGR